MAGLRGLPVMFLAAASVGQAAETHSEHAIYCGAEVETAQYTTVLANPPSCSAYFRHGVDGGMSGSQHFSALSSQCSPTASNVDTGIINYMGLGKTAAECAAALYADPDYPTCHVAAMTYAQSLVASGCNPEGNFYLSLFEAVAMSDAYFAMPDQGGCGDLPVVDNGVWSPDLGNYNDGLASGNVHLQAGDTRQLACYQDYTASVDASSATCNGATHQWEWSPGPAATCVDLQQLTCDTPSDPVGGTWTSDGTLALAGTDFAAGATATLVCASPYHMGGQPHFVPTKTCTLGAWTTEEGKPMGQCLPPISCSAGLATEHGAGHWSDPPGESWIINDVATLTCDDGFIAMCGAGPCTPDPDTGSVIATCGADHNCGDSDCPGIWQGNHIATCESTACQAPGEGNQLLVDGGTWSVPPEGGWQSGSRATLTCTDPQATETPPAAAIACADGEWSGDIHAQCIPPLICNPLPTHVHAGRGSWTSPPTAAGFHIGDTATLDCHPNYILHCGSSSCPPASEMTITCNADPADADGDGIWSGAAMTADCVPRPVCSRQTLFANYPKLHGSWPEAPTTSGWTPTAPDNRALLTCDPGYHLNPAADSSHGFAVCYAIGDGLPTWHDNSGTCVANPPPPPDTCPVLNTVGGQRHLNTVSADASAASVGDSATLNCAAGYALPADDTSTTVTCQSGGLWSPDPSSQCTKQCNALGTTAAEHWTVLGPQGASIDSTSAHFDTESVATITCTPEIQYDVSTPSITCTSGQWSPAQPSCVLRHVNCPGLPDVPNGQWSQPPSGGWNPTSARPSFNCHGGYDYVGQVNITCSWSGHWSGTGITPAPVCSQPPPPPPDTCASPRLHYGIPHGEWSIHTAGSLPGAIATLSCTRGDLKPDPEGAKLTCGADLQWTGDVTASCESPPPPPPHVAINSGSPTPPTPTSPPCWGVGTSVLFVMMALLTVGPVMIIIPSYKQTVANLPVLEASGSGGDANALGPVHVACLVAGFVNFFIDLWLCFGLAVDYPLLSLCRLVTLLVASGTIAHLGRFTQGVIEEQVHSSSNSMMATERVQWTAQNRGVEPAVLVLSAITCRIEGLALVRLNLGGKMVLAMPTPHRYYEFIVRAGLFQFMIKDVPHLAMGLAQLLGSDCSASVSGVLYINLLYLLVSIVRGVHTKAVAKQGGLMAVFSAHPRGQEWDAGAKVANSQGVDYQPPVLNLDEALEEGKGSGESDGGSTIYDDAEAAPRGTILASGETTPQNDKLAALESQPSMYDTAPNLPYPPR